MLVGLNEMGSLDLPLSIRQGADVAEFVLGLPLVKRFSVLLWQATDNIFSTCGQRLVLNIRNH